MVRKRKARQGLLNGMEAESIPEVDDAAEIYHEAKLARVKLTEEEHEAKDNLIDKMKENSLSLYETPDGLVVSITATSNVKTKRKSEAKDEEEDDGDEAEE